MIIVNKRVNLKFIFLLKIEADIPTVNYYKSNIVNIS